MNGMGTVAHISGPTAPPGVEDSEHDICCMGAVMRGAAYCTCWDPIFNLEQAAADTSTTPTIRQKCCQDCAYRQGSPERERDDGELDEIVAHPDRTFWCHQGMRKVVAWHHPDGRELPAGPEDDYKPLIVGEVPYLADGTAGERCAGWAALTQHTSPQQDTEGEG